MSWSRSPPRIRTAVSLRSTIRRSKPASSSPSSESPAAWTSSTARNTMPTSDSVKLRRNSSSSARTRSRSRCDCSAATARGSVMTAVHSRKSWAAAPGGQRVLGAAGGRDGERAPTLGGEQRHDDREAGELEGQHPDAQPQRAPGERDERRQGDDQRPGRPEDQQRESGQHHQLGAVLRRPPGERLPDDQRHRQQGDHGRGVRGGRRAQRQQEGAGAGRVDDRSGDQADDRRARGGGDEQPEHVVLRRQPRRPREPGGEDQAGDHRLGRVGHAEAQADVDRTSAGDVA